MKNTPPTPAPAADTVTVALSENELARRLNRERLRVLAEQASAELVVAILVLLGCLAVFQDQLNMPWMVCAAVIAAIYLIRLALTKHFLRPGKRHRNLTQWLRLFVLFSVISGTAWGVFASLLILFSDANMSPYVSALIGGLTVAAIFSWVALLSSYIGYTLGIIQPIAITLLIRDSGFDPGKAAVITTYATLLLVIAANFYKQLETWLRLATENAELINRLRDLTQDKWQSDLAWNELEGRLQRLLRQIQ